MTEHSVSSETQHKGYRWRVAAHIGQKVADRTVLSEQKDIPALSMVDQIKAVGISRKYLQPAIEAACAERGLTVQTYINVDNTSGYHETTSRLRVRVVEHRGKRVLAPLEEIAASKAADGQFIESLYPPSKTPLPASSTELPDDFTSIHY